MDNNNISGFKPRKRRNKENKNMDADTTPTARTSSRFKGLTSFMDFYPSVTADLNRSTNIRSSLPFSDITNTSAREPLISNSSVQKPVFVPPTHSGTVTPAISIAETHNQGSGKQKGKTRVKAVTSFMNHHNEHTGDSLQNLNKKHLADKCDSHNTYAAGRNQMHSNNSLHDNQQLRHMKYNSRRVSMVGTELFPEKNDLNSTNSEDNVDYENIESSHINGLSDSDTDGCHSGVDQSTDDEISSEDEESTDKPHFNVEESPEDDFKEWCKKIIDAVPPQYNSLGPPDVICGLCGAQMWKEERCNKNVTKGTPKFTLCCSRGKVQLPAVPPTPPYLLSLYNDKVRGPSFRRCIRMYNSMFSFTSMGGNVDDSINKGGAPYIYRLNGQNHHQIGSLLPTEGTPPKFCQLYIYDTENEVNNRMRWINVKDANKVDPDVVEGLLKMLDETNELVKYFRMARDRFEDEQIVDLKIVLKQSRSESGRENHISASDEVAAIMVGDTDDTCGRRDIVIDSKIDGLQRISDIHPKLMALQYPLLFPYGEDGFHENIYYVKVPNEPQPLKDTASQREFYASKLQVRLDEGQTMRMSGRLWQQYVVDSFSAVEQSRLWYYRCNQTKLRNELYSHICDYMREGDGDLSNVGKSYILPSSFVGSKRYMQQNFQDSLAVCRHIGHPDLFLTMTCNPMWQEVLYMMSLLPACRPADCPDIIARVFKLKLQQLTDDIKKKKFFGKCIGVMFVVEWQKRGLPHVHMLIWLEGDAKKYLNKNVDKFVSAEIPNKVKDPVGYAAVKLFMMHGPCGLERRKSPCMRDGKCTRRFPKRYNARTMFDQCGFPIYKRRRTSNVVRVRKASLDNQWVVPYNRDLIVRYQCHINIEVCNRARCLKYLFKYCLKGSDRATVHIKSKQRRNSEAGSQDSVDEINRFFDGRYVCGAEACHRIFAFDIHYRSVSVERLPFHLEGKRRCNYNEKEKPKTVVDREKFKQSKLEAFFKLCLSNPEAHQYTYDEIPKYFVWNKDSCTWTARKSGTTIGRLSYTHHSNGELWYLRMLISCIRGPTSFQFLRTVNGIVYSTYHEACKALGLLDDDKEWIACIEECKKYGLPPQIRQLFVQIIVNNPVGDLKTLWELNCQSMCDDILYTRRKITGNPELKLSETELQWFALAEIDKILRTIGKSIKDFQHLPQPPEEFLNSSRNNLILEETSYNREDMSKEHKMLQANLNQEQAVVYNSVLQAVNNRNGGIFFVYGSGGCGKTYLWKTIITRLRAEGRIVLPVASSGIAATLMPGGRTAHSRFKIPIMVDELSTCNIAHKSDIAELLKKTDLIIWDEAPMQNRYAFECLDRSLRDIMKVSNPNRATLPFGGIIFLMGGDFRQILPVISRGSRSDIVASCIIRSRLWDHCKLFLLKENMRLNRGKNEVEKREIEDFARWVLNVGDGHDSLDINMSDSNESEDHKISIPNQFVISANSESLDAIIQSTFPELRRNYCDHKYLSSRAILTLTNETVAHINKLILENIPGEYITYLSADRAEDLAIQDNQIDIEYPVEYLNSMSMPGIPLHELKLKTGVCVMLMRNLNQTLGLCNGTRMIVKRCLTNAIQCEVITGSHAGTTHFIPRMDMAPTDTRLHFKLIRRQFPIQICYAMTINKAQGQSLEFVGLYLPDPVFTHGQLYVALSRVTSPSGLKVLIDSDNGRTTNETKNVVYPEVFYNLPKL